MCVASIPLFFGATGVLSTIGFSFFKILSRIVMNLKKEIEKFHIEVFLSKF